MKIYRVRKSREYGDELLIDQEKVHSMEELELAYHLAKDSFRKKKNIAKKFRYEFLLWLSGKTDIKSAIRWAKPSDGALLVLFEGSRNLRQARLKKKAEPLDIERISLSRIRN
jgi:tRNA threonylcarbamoyladenosine modification (KEOPS) complex Cgi121 subunit